MCQKTVDEVKKAVDEGEAICRRLKKEYCEDSGMYTVFLFSLDAEINYYTVYFLPVFMQKKRVTSFLIVSCFDYIEEMVAKNAKVPYKYVACTEYEAKLIGRYCTEPDERKRIREQIIINGTDDPEEYRYRSVLGINSISKADITAYCVFDFRYTPDENEVKKAIPDKQKIRYKKINWDDFGGYIPIDDGIVRDFPEAVDEELKKLIDSGKICEKDNLILFSDTQTTRHIVEYLDTYNIIAILDNAVEKSGRQINNIPVLLPEAFFGSIDAKVKIIVPTRSYMLICEQLYAYGYELGSDVFVTFRRLIPSNQDETDWREGLYRGKELYDSIRSKYPEDRIYMCTYEGTGDIYLIGMYLKDRMKYDGASKCVVVVASNASRKLLETFDLESVISEILVLDGRTECNKLLHYVRGIGYEYANAAVLNNDYGVMLLKRLSGIHGIDFNTLFQKIIFFADKKRVSYGMRRESSESIFVKESLKPGRTVLLSPYANTTYGITEEAWAKLAGDLKSKGYDVCTNVSGKDEKAIPGTKAVFVPYIQLIDFLDRAGGFVGLRSGLCDIVSGSTAKKVIIYPEKAMFHTSSYYNYFSLEKMFDVRENLKELIVGEKETDISDSVISGLSGGDISG
jgi:hypothetical protein